MGKPDHGISSLASVLNRDAKHFENEKCERGFAHKVTILSTAVPLPRMTASIL
jgi:hypothetical protein